MHACSLDFLFVSTPVLFATIAVNRDITRIISADESLSLAKSPRPNSCTSLKKLLRMQQFRQGGGHSIRVTGDLNRYKAPPVGTFDALNRTLSRACWIISPARCWCHDRNEGASSSNARYLGNFCIFFDVAEWADP